MNLAIPDGNTHIHCIQCWAPMASCICSLAHRLDNQQHIVLYIHHKEWSRRSNSAHLLRLMLKNLSVHVHGARNQPTRFEKNSNRRSCVLFPTEEAEPLTINDRGRFDTLILLDGNWRQAKKLSNRVKNAMDPMFRTLPYTSPSEFKLRTQSQQDRLSTYEAAARALSILEGAQWCERLMPIFRAHVDVTLEQRSRRGLPRQKNLRSSS